MATSLDALLSTAKNIVNALSSIQQALLRGQGNVTSATITAQTVIAVGTGRLVSVTVVISGGAAGGIFNAGSIAAMTASNALMTIPATVGIFPAGHTFDTGLIVVPGAGQSINVTYYQD